MTNTINNVPRELLADLLGNDHDKRIMAERHLLAMLANAPSPAGVDGLEVVQEVAWLNTATKEATTHPVVVMDWDDEKEPVESLMPISQHEAIIDGLRGEVAELESTLADNLELSGKRAVRIAEIGHELADAISERDQQAHRIGELEAALEFACKSLAQVTSSDGSGHADIAVSVLRMAGRKEADASQIVESYKAGAKLRIDAALSAGKEGK